MNRPAIRGGAAALFAVLSSGPAWAQDPSPLVLTPHQATQLFSGPYFFLAIVAGLVLAVGFQFLLTNLSFAAGVSAMRVGPGEEGEIDRDRAVERGGKPTTFGSRARKVTAGIGIWALVTASIALFFASWLAVELSLTISALIGAIIGLVIWALFYLVMTTVQATAAWSLVGSLLRTVGSGLSTVWSGMTGVFSRSEEARVADMAGRITRTVKDELFRDVRMDRVRDEVRGYVSQLSPKPIDPAAVRKEVQQLLDETEIQAVAEHEGEPIVGRETVVSVLRMKHPTGVHLSPRDVQAVAQGVDDALRVIKDEAFSGKDRVSAVADTALRLTGKSKEEAAYARQKVEEWLRSTGKEALDPEGIKRDLDRLFVQPASGFTALRDRARAIDRDTIEAVLSQRSDISREEAHRIVETVEQWARAILAKSSHVKPDLAAAKERASAKVRAYLESLKRPELDYDTIRTDVERLLDEPGVSPDTMAERVKAMDRDTIKSILASRRDLTEQDAERILQQVEAARDSVMRRIRALRDEVERRMLVARDETYRQAEEARKTAATAAWWSVATAVISAIAAAFGGMVAVAAG